MFSYGPHSLGLAENAGEPAIWTTLASEWIHEQLEPARSRAVTGRLP